MSQSLVWCLELVGQEPMHDLEFSVVPRAHRHRLARLAKWLNLCCFNLDLKCCSRRRPVSS
jgi:hypothetical protein